MSKLRPTTKRKHEKIWKSYLRNIEQLEGRAAYVSKSYLYMLVADEHDVVEKTVQRVILSRQKEEQRDGSEKRRRESVINEQEED